MRELYPDPEGDWTARIRRFLLDFDARFDNFLFQSGRWAREIGQGFSMFMDRFHVAGWRRWVFVEPFRRAPRSAPAAWSSCWRRAAGVPRDRR